jgi:uncharacterized protein
MKVALIGATGNVGSRVFSELISRGHSVTAIARNAEKVPPSASVAPKNCDIEDQAALNEILSGHDAVISSVRFKDRAPQILIDAVRSAKVKRYLVVGGAASLETPSGVPHGDTPEFPAQFKPEAAAGRAFLDVLRAQEDLEWTFLSPSAVFFAGDRTGKFRIGDDTLLVGSEGSRISFEDYAIALVDELETPKHLRKRFTVGY